MKQLMRIIAMLLVLLMTVSVFAACGNKQDDREDPKETERETERETEAQTEHDLTNQEIENLKNEMSASILDALEKVEQTSQTEADTEPDAGEEVTTSYGGVVEDLLGSLGGLGNGDYDYKEIISDVLDLYIGSNSTSDFIKGLIFAWIQSKFEQSTDQPTEEATTEVTLPENSEDALKEYIADKTAEAVANAVVERINEAVDATVYDMIYNSVFEAMKGNEGYMDGILEEMIPGYGQLSGLLGGFGQ